MAIIFFPPGPSCHYNLIYTAMTIYTHNDRRVKCIRKTSIMMPGWYLRYLESYPMGQFGLWGDLFLVATPFGKIWRGGLG